MLFRIRESEKNKNTRNRKYTFNRSVSKTRKLVTVEDLSAHDGLFSLCLKSIYELNNIKAKQLAIEDFIRSYGSFEDLCRKSKIDHLNIIKEIKKINA